jgi:hypothetical protein
MPITVLLPLVILSIQSAVNAYQMSQSGVGVLNVIWLGMCVFAIVGLVRKTSAGRTMARVIFGLLTAVAVGIGLLATFAGAALGALLGGAMAGGGGAAGGTAFGVGIGLLIGLVALFMAGFSVAGFFLLGSRSAAEHCTR